MLTKKWIRILLLLASCCSMFVSYRLLMKTSTTPSAPSRTDFVGKILGRNQPSASNQQCTYLKLDPWNEKMRGFFKEMSRKECKTVTKNWVEIVGGRFVITPEAAKKNGQITCSYIPFLRSSDHHTDEGESKAFVNNSLIPTDFFRVECSSNSGATYSNIHAGIHKNDALLAKKSSVDSGLGLDVLILGFDSVSRMHFMRKMPKTLAYLTDVLRTVVLKGYNIVGDGTPQALIPIFTGKTELELPRPLKRLNNGLYADVFPMAWKDFSKKGYVTAWSEDLPTIGTFTYRMRGFKEQPTDHYMRTFHLKTDTSKHQPLCIGDRPRARVVLDWMSEFMAAYRKNSKFGFMFHSELSHDSNDLLQTADDDLLNSLKNLYENKLLNNTLLIVMSDHGARFSSIRSTLQGKQEERNPFFSLTFPKWFKDKYPQAYKNVLTNTERLVTPFDIHPTFLDLLDFQGFGLGDKKQRGISLFKEIPINRTCTDAQIEPHWCNCLQWVSIKPDDPIAYKAATQLIKHINQLTGAKRDLCAELHLQEVVNAVVFQPTKEMMAFKKTNDADGFAADMSDHTRSDTQLLQLTIRTSPNNGLYESTVQQNLEKNIFTVNADTISRINKYGDDPHCIYDTDEQLRKYCFCKDRLPTQPTRS